MRESGKFEVLNRRAPQAPAKRLVGLIIIIVVVVVRGGPTVGDASPSTNTVY